MSYIRKCWRDTAPAFFLFLGLSLLLAFFTMKDRAPNSAPPGNVLLTILEAWRELGLGFGLSGCALALRSVGTDVSRGFGDFLFTRPRSRKYFVWAGWAVGVAQILSIVMSVSLLVVAILYQESGSFWRSLPATVVFKQQVVAVDVALLMASVLVFGMAAYSATYFVSVATKGRSAALVMCLIFLYDSLGSPQGWGHVPLPSLLVRPYYAVMPQQFSNAHTIEICTLIAWIVCAVAFAFAAQLVFERSDI
jgi:hypothetical protein